MTLTFHVKMDLNFFKGICFLEIFVGVTAIDVIIKTIFLATGIFPTLGLNWIRRIILHFLASICLLSLTAVDAKLSTPTNNYLSILDPYLGIFIAIVLTVIAVPTGRETKFRGFKKVLMNIF